jgi:hypothetical protein
MLPNSVVLPFIRGSDRTSWEWKERVDGEERRGREEEGERRGGIYTPVHGLLLRHSHDDRHLWQSDKSTMLASESGTSSTFFVRGTGTLHAAIHAAFWTITQLAVDVVSAAK